MEEEEEEVVSAVSVRSGRYRSTNRLEHTHGHTPER